MKNANNIIFIILLLAAGAFIAGYYASPKAESKPPVFITVQPSSIAMPSLIPTVLSSAQPGETKLLAVPLVAVDKENQGVITSINIEERAGDGRIYIDYSTGAPLLGSETQTSILNAVAVAKDITGKTLSGINLYYSFSTDAQVVGGGSAGAATAIATAALVSGKQLKKGFLITGSVDDQGNIGLVGRVLEKAEAAKAGGFTTFLVPRGEGTTQVPVEKCTERQAETALIKSCNTTYENKEISDLVGIRIIEVDDVGQAYDLMVQ